MGLAGTAGILSLTRHSVFLYFQFSSAALLIAQIRKRYLWTLLATFIAAIFAAGLINLIIDPYGTFHLVTIRGLNLIKPNPDHDIETIKAYALRHVSPDALILGNDALRSDSIPHILFGKKRGIARSITPPYEVRPCTPHASAGKS